MKYKIIETSEGIKWHHLANVIEKAGLGKRNPIDVEAAFRGSQYVSYLYIGEVLAGAARALSDRASTSAIYDVVVLPHYQGKGYGSIIMKNLLDRLPARSVLLVSVPKFQKFYEKYGFVTLKTAMLKHIDMDYWETNGYLE